MKSRGDVPISVLIAGPYASLFLPISIDRGMQSIHSAFYSNLESFSCHSVPEIPANEKCVFINLRKRQLTQNETPAEVVYPRFPRSI